MGWELVLGHLNFRTILEIWNLAGFAVWDENQLNYFSEMSSDYTFGKIKEQANNVYFCDFRNVCQCVLVDRI